MSGSFGRLTLLTACTCPAILRRISRPVWAERIARTVPSPPKNQPRFIR